MPWFNKLVHLPMFLWDPRTGGGDARRGALAQTIDIAPTVLRFFGLEPTPDMQGRDLAAVLDGDQRIRDGALFGIHGGHVNVTDGRHVYMRSAVEAGNAPLEEYTLMPTHMRSRFAVGELTAWEPAEPLSFTKGIRTIRMPATAKWVSSWQHGTLLFDLQVDPGQEHPLTDDEVELRMLRLLAQLMHDSDAPRSQFDRLGIPYHGEIGTEHLLVRVHAERAAATAEPLPPITDLPAADMLTTPLMALLNDGDTRTVLERHVPELVHTELVAAATQLTLVDLARTAVIPAAALRAVAQDFVAVSR
jgi:hypothetical protein